MIFGKGRIPAAEFQIKGEKLEIVKEFSYLGVVFTPQLSFTNHVRNIVAKAKSRIAYLYINLPLYEMSLEMIISIFQTYILAMFMYCAPIWSVKLEAKNSIEMLNAVFNSYMKRYLGLPKYAHGAAIHYYCRTWPLYYAVRYLASEAVTKLSFPPNSLNGHQLSFANATPLPPYQPEIEMDQDFPRKSVYISRNRRFRMRCFRELFNIEHFKSCQVVKFHTRVTYDCKCIYCGQHATRSHTCTLTTMQ